MGFGERLKHAWNAFKSRDPTELSYNESIGVSYGYRPDRLYLRRGSERTIISAIYNRIAVDVSAVTMEHARLDENKRYLESLPSKFNECLTLSANIDQTGRDFIRDAVISMLDEGVVAIVPVETTINPSVSGSYDILQLRTGKVLEWYPKHIKVQLYNEEKGIKEDIVLPKANVAIVENPFYTVMNSPNSTMRRLIHKLSLMDAIDEQTSYSKMDLIVQLPYVIKSEQRKREAERRRAEIERQLKDSKYGVAYIDGTEKLTQLNRSLENNLLGQIEYLTKQLYSQLSISEEILNGTADEKTMLNYNNGTITPIVNALTEEMQRKFITKTGRSQGQAVVAYKDPFKLVPVGQIADIADKFTRNEILTSNEVRQIIGFKPSKDPKADELRNKNLNESKEQTQESMDVNGNPIAEGGLEGEEEV